VVRAFAGLLVLRPEAMGELVEESLKGALVDADEIQ
jgi:hypothetical protein